MRLSTDELVRLAPKQWAYLRTPTPTWPDIVDTADWLCHDLGVSKPLWGEVCMAMGYEVAAIALAIVSANPAGHFTSSPGGYFYGMVAKAKASELNRTRAIWDFRTGSRREGKERIHGGGRDPAAGPRPTRPGSAEGRAPTQPYTTCNAAMCSSRAAISVAYCVCTA